MAKLRHLLTIFLLTLFLVPSLASVAQVKADSYTPGPVFALSNGHTLTVQFDGFSSDVVANLTSALNVYVPKLLQIFYEPSVDYTVTIQYRSDVSDVCTAMGTTSPACSGSGVIYLGADWVSESSFDQMYGLVQELTHVLQLAPNGPDSVLSDDANQFYITPTALVMDDVLVTRPENDNPTFGYYLDSVSVSAEYGVEVAAAIYREASTNPHSGLTAKTMWLLLYRADHGVFKKMNSLLSQLAAQGGPQVGVDGFREVIRQSLSLQTLDGLPVRQWLAAEGMLTRDEVASFSAEPLFDRLNPEAIMVDRAVNVNAAESYAIFYDAATKISWGNAAYSGTKDPWGFDFGVFELGKSYLDIPPTSRIDVHLTTSTGVYDQSFLMPQYTTPNGPLPNWSVDDAFENAVVLASPDGWLRLINGTAYVNGQPWPVVNGVLRFTTATPTVNIDLPDGHHIENFVTYRALMVVGAFNLTALQVMHDTDQIRPTTTTTVAQSASTQPIQSASTTYYASNQPHFQCIIATAAYGSEMAPEVVYMRYVRDSVVGSTPTGKILRDDFNNWYYSWSPPIAQYISDKPLLRAVFRVLLVPIDISVRVADLAFHAVGGGNFGSILGFVFAAIISTLSYIVIPTALSVFAIRWAKRRWH
jgi:hypothetical protein